jgi:stage II sporulation protein AB (anti-sigma F factor)
MKSFSKEKTALNKMRLELISKGENESFARSTVAAFAAQLNPTLDELNDIKTAVSEAVTNAVVHAYLKSTGEQNIIVIGCALYEDSITVDITDYGIGIPNIDKALEPFYTTRPDEERSGMGFTVMQSFMDTLKVETNARGGTTVTMQKFFTKAKRVSGVV